MADFLRSIPDILVKDPKIAEILRAIKEIVEIREGIRGESGDRFLSYDELIELLQEGASDHKYLSNLQGGDADEYYHLTLADYSELVAWLDDVTLSDGGGIETPAGITAGQLKLTPRSDAISAERGVIFFDDDDSSVYVCTEE